jgi:adenosylcobinamide amidohydrolase
MKIPIPGVVVSLTAEALLISSRELLTVLSSSPVGGGFTQTHHILNAHVHKGYDNPDPAQDLIAFAQLNGVRGAFIGMMTAANLEKTRLAVEQSQGLTVCAILTAGLSNACSAGITPPAPYRPGTINIILLVDNRLSHAALVNAVITATEAKCDSLRRLGRSAPDGELATGTSTDTIAIAATERGAPLPYAGPATAVG